MMLRWPRIISHSSDLVSAPLLSRSYLLHSSCAAGAGIILRFIGVFFLATAPARQGGGSRARRSCAGYGQDIRSRRVKLATDPNIVCFEGEGRGVSPFFFLWNKAAGALLREKAVVLGTMR